MPRLKNVLQSWVALSGIRWTFVRRFYVAAYAAALRFLKRIWRGLPVESVYLRQGLLDPGWVPGVSDLDTLWVVKSDSPDGAFLELLDRLTRAKRLIPFLGEAEVTDAKGFSLYLREGDAKRLASPFWRLVSGRDLRPVPTAAESWRERWKCWAKAAESYELLLKCFLERGPAIADRIAARKFFLDVHRWLGGATTPGREMPTRDAAARALRDSATGLEWAVRLDGFPWKNFPFILSQTLAALRDRGDACARLLPKSGVSTPVWSSDILADAWESQAAEIRFQRLAAECGPGLRGLVWNTLLETCCVLDDALSPEETASWIARFHRVRAGDPGLQGAVVLYSRRVFQHCLWTVRHGTPFSTWSLRPEISAVRAAAWRHSSDALTGGVFSGRRDSERDDAWSPPPAPVLRTAARQAAADWLARWRNGLSLMPESPPLYRWHLLLAPVLSVRLYLETGRAGDPADLPGMLREYRASFEDGRAWIDALSGALATESRDWTPAQMQALFRAEVGGFERASRALASMISS